MKRVTAFIMALTLMVGLTACGGAEKGNASSQQPPAESQSQTASSFDKETQAFLDSITVDNAEFKGICGSNAMWYYKDNVMVIKGTGAVNDRTWRTEELYNQGMMINWVIIDEGITSLCDGAFSGAGILHFPCDHISKVILPSTLQSIGRDAFIYTDLTSITIPDSVTEIGSDIFDGCLSLTAINYSGPAEGYPWGMPNPQSINEPPAAETN